MAPENSGEQRKQKRRVFILGRLEELAIPPISEQGGGYV
jgi:hypothetical protein